LSPDVLGSDPIGDKAYRQRIISWVDAQWAAKDQLIETLLDPAASPKR